MARRKAPLEINQFTGGLYTEPNPLLVSPNVSHDEINMDMLRDGSRKKRLGFDYESGATLIDSGVAPQLDKQLSSSLFKWENAGGNADKSLLVVQVGQYMGVFDLDNSPITSSLVYSKTFNSNRYDTTFSYAVVDGILVVGTGEKQVYSYTYDGVSVTEDTNILYIRDLFGVEAEVSSVKLTAPENVNVRPSSTNDEHTYNLRNQTWALPRYSGSSEVLTDPIVAFNSASSGLYPSNADTIIPSFYADPNDAEDRLVERFFADDLFTNPIGTSTPPKGYFIIDALERGASRLSNETALRAANPALTETVTNLPTDKTPGGATVLNEYAGRVWYAGFSGSLEGGDNLSPRMSSYVLFSSLVKSKNDIYACYQQADPTSNIDSSLVDTDGGFIKLDDAYNINKLVALGGSQFVFAENGVWRISGTSEDNFTATAYQTERMSDRGCVASNSVVLANNEIYFWGEDAIYKIARNNVNLWEIVDITEKKIKNFFLNIPITEKENCFGAYDSYEKTIRWVYTNVTDDKSNNHELVYNLLFEAFTPNKVSKVGSVYPKITALSEAVPYSFATVDIRDDQGQIISSLEIRTSRFRELTYLVITGVTTTFRFTLGNYRDRGLRDFSSALNGPANYQAFLQTGHTTGGSTTTNKRVDYLYTFFKQTEEILEGSSIVSFESSCLVNAVWDWTTSSNAHKESTPRQAYRYNHVYIPEGPNDPFDTGRIVIETKNRIRGSGTAVSFKFTSEEGKDMHIYGWSFPITADDD